MQDYYYVIYTDSLRDRVKKVTWMSEGHIIKAARWELEGSGESFESMAEIKWDEDEDEYERELTDEEYLQLSVEKLGDDSRTFEIYAATEAGKEDFMQRAKFYGIEDEAKKVIESFV